MASFFCLATITFSLIQLSSAQTYSIRCTFETSDCTTDLRQLQNDDHDFTYASGATPSGGTGPTSGAGGSSRYAYLEASGKRKDSTARLTTVRLGFEGDVCIKFWYTMFGTAVGTLSVLLIEDNEEDITLWEQTGNQGPNWINVQEDYSVTSMNQMIVFEAKIGSTFSSDIALDNIEVYSGTCAASQGSGSTRAMVSTSSSPSSDPMIWSCDFDEDYNDTCKVVQVENTKNFNWLRLSGRTPSSETGPPSSYDGDHYFYVEASGNTLRPGDKTIFTSPVLRLSGDLLCLRVDFYYYMFGSSMGNLDVRAVGEEFNGSVVNITGDKGEQWFKASNEVNVPVNEITLEFIATRGGSFRSDLAVDRIKVYDCSSGAQSGTTRPSPVTTPPIITTTTFPNAGAENVQLVPTFVAIDDDVPGSVVCKVVNSASLPFTWNGFKWYDPSGNPIGTNNPWVIVDTVYHVPSAVSSDFWTSTLYVDALDYTLNGKYVCEVNYGNEVTRREAMVDVKGCPSDNYTCKTGGGCIPCSLLCDRQNDCGDMSDELGCGSDLSPRETSNCA